MISFMDPMFRSDLERFRRQDPYYRIYDGSVRPGQQRTYSTNVPPGTVIDEVITAMGHPNFYLCAHKGQLVGLAVMLSTTVPFTGHFPLGALHGSAQQLGGRRPERLAGTLTRGHHGKRSRMLRSPCSSCATWSQGASRRRPSRHRSTTRTCCALGHGSTSLT